MPHGTLSENTTVVNRPLHSKPTAQAMMSEMAMLRQQRSKTSLRRDGHDRCNLCRLLRLSDNRKPWDGSKTKLDHPFREGRETVRRQVHPACHQAQSRHIRTIRSQGNIPVLDYVGAIPRSEMMMLLNFTGYADYMDWCAWVWQDAPANWNPFESEKVEVGFTPTSRAWRLWCSLTYRRAQMGRVSFSVP
jgi:hypothetical protein